ncbi:MAG TPA: hypothetical protein VHO72_05370 [Bacteroidales bacterium]|nr:hypothetical protein [Bacteroidales bacterium]
MALSFTLDHLIKGLKYVFLILFFSCLGAAIGYGLQNKWMIFLFVNVSTGGSLLAVSFTSLRYFRSIKNV